MFNIPLHTEFIIHVSLIHTKFNISFYTEFNISLPTKFIISLHYLHTEFNI